MNCKFQQYHKTWYTAWQSNHKRILGDKYYQNILWVVRGGHGNAFLLGKFGLFT